MDLDSIQISLDASVIGDAVNTLILIHHRLRKRHGEQFRALDRRLDALVDGDCKIMRLVPMPGGVMLAAPSAEVTELFKEARRLELIL